MSFWKEDKNDDIWEDFRYWLENPITEKEQEMRDKEIKDYINASLKKMFGD